MAAERGPSGVSRRGFLAAAAATAAVTQGAPAEARPAATAPPVGRGPVSLRVDGQRIFVETATLAAVLDARPSRLAAQPPDGRGVPRRQRRRRHRRSRSSTVAASACPSMPPGSARSRCAPSRRRARRSFSPGGTATARSRSPRTRRAGDLVLQPGAFSSRPGVRACRLTMAGIRPGLDLVAPFFQGVRLCARGRSGCATATGRGRCTGRPPWRSSRAGTPASGSTLATTGIGTRRSTSGRRESARSLGFDSEAWGPIDDNRSAGGLAWRVNVFDGDWTAPRHALPRLAVGRERPRGPRARAPRVGARRRLRRLLVPRPAGDPRRARRVAPAAARPAPLPGVAHAALRRGLSDVRAERRSEGIRRQGTRDGLPADAPLQLRRHGPFAPRLRAGPRLRVPRRRDEARPGLGVARGAVDRRAGIEFGAAAEPGQEGDGQDPPGPRTVALDPRRPRWRTPRARSTSRPSSST